LTPECGVFAAKAQQILVQRVRVGMSLALAEIKLASGTA
jgi:hypothetical protein